MCQKLVVLKQILILIFTEIWIVLKPFRHFWLSFIEQMHTQNRSHLFGQVYNLHWYLSWHCWLKLASIRCTAVQITWIMTFTKQASIESVPTSLQKNVIFFTLEALRSFLELVETCPCVPCGIGIWKNVGFWGEGKTGVPGEKPLEARERTNNKSDTAVHNQYNLIRLWARYLLQSSKRINTCL